MLRHPSGKYAAAINARREEVKVFNEEGKIVRRTIIVALYVDPASEGSRIARIIERGHAAIDLKKHMLRGSKTSIHTGKAYRRIRLRATPVPPVSVALGFKEGTPISGRSPLHIKAHLARMFLRNYNHKSGEWRTMSDKPDAAEWVVPPMPAFNVTKILRDQLPSYLKGSIITP
jgi:hypothetical protein